MHIQQAVSHALGVAVLGTAQVSASPDHATIRCGVVRTHDDPPDAFAATRTATSSVRRFLDEAGVTEVRASRIKLDPHYVQHETTNRRVQRGYAATLHLHVVVRELDTLEAVLAGLIGHGVNDLQSVTFGTSKLAAVRRQARTEAMAAARAKAELYAEAAGRPLGRVIHVEDGNPEALGGREAYAHQVAAVVGDGPGGAVDPGAIVVGGAVHLTFAWGDEER